MAEYSHAQCNEMWAFENVMQKLSYCLREASSGARMSAMRVQAMFPHVSEIDGNKDASADLDFAIDASFLLPLYIDLAYVYLRCAADLWLASTKHLIFRRTGTMPKSFRDFVKSCDALKRWQPVYDPERLGEIVRHQTGWFDRIASKDEGRSKGIRDILMHNTVETAVSYAWAPGVKPQAYVGFGRTGPDHSGTRLELIGILKESVAGFCSFCSAISSLLKWDVAYKKWIAPYGDCLPCFGADDDVVEFWPQL